VKTIAAQMTFLTIEILLRLANQRSLYACRPSRIPHRPAGNVGCGERGAGGVRTIRAAARDTGVGLELARSTQGGKHKQVFDIGQWDLSVDTPLRVYLDAFRDVFNIVPPDVNLVLGIQRVAFPMNASDALEAGG
jgi:hypothetical protein